MKTPVLNDVHERSGGRIADFAGWRLPMDYGSAIQEVKAVRTAAGLFDVSHMGRLEVVGEQALPALQRLFTNDLGKLVDNGGIYAMMCNPQGGVIDDLIAFRKNENHFLVVVNASNLEKDKKWILENLPEGVTLKDNSADTILIALQGPKAGETLAKAGFEGVSEIKRFHMAEGKIAGADALATRSGYTGEDGFEICAANADAEKIWEALLEAGKDFGVIPCGLAARDVLRTESALPLYGHELDADITPAEASLMRFVKMDKGDFIGRDAIATQIEKGLERKLIGIMMEGRFVPRPEDVVETPAGQGKVTSGTFSPMLGCGIAMAFLPASVEVGEKVDVLIHGKPKPGIVSKLPLYSKKKA